MLDKRQIDELRSVLIENLKNYDGDKKIKLNINPKLLGKLIFEKGDDANNVVYKIFNEKLRNLCKKLDLTGVSFDNFIARSFDFRGYNGIEINPQTIYDKSLGGSILKGVKINGALKGCNIEETDFTGSVGAVINPQTIYDKNLLRTVLCDATINGSLDGCCLEGTDFEGAIFNGNSNVINPRTLRWNSLVGTNLNGIVFNEPLVGCDIKHANFTGSTGAKIVVQKIYKKNLAGTILKDATIYGSLGGCIIDKTNFEGSKGAVMSYEQYCELQEDNNLTDVKIDYEYNNTLEEINKAFQKVKK